MKRFGLVALFDWCALVALASFFLVSCDSAVEDTKKVVVSTVQSINKEFVIVREGQETLVNEVKGLYGRWGDLDLSTKGMDATEGGLYASFPGGKYYYKNKEQGSALYASPGRPVDEAIKKQVKFLEYVDPFLQKTWSASDVQTVAFYGVREPITLALMSPWFDVVSRLPPGIDLNMFEWYQRGLKSTGPAVWSVKPFTDLSTGWVMDVSMPVVVDGQVKGVGVSSVNLEKLGTKYLKDQKSAVLLLGSDTTVVAESPLAQTYLGIRPLESVDFFKQVKENSFAAGKYLLVDPAQPADLQELGRQILLGKESFEATLGGKRYAVQQSVVSENQMRVVGLTAR